MSSRAGSRVSRTLAMEAPKICKEGSCNKQNFSRTALPSSEKTGVCKTKPESQANFFLFQVSFLGGMEGVDQGNLERFLRGVWESEFGPTESLLPFSNGRTEKLMSACLQFQDAIRTLNTLQTNASYLEQVKRERGDPQLQLQAMAGFLERTGLKVNEVFF